MITVALSANGRRSSVLVDNSTKLGDFLAEQRLNPSVVPYLDGAPISDVQKGKTFTELGIEESCVISSVVKTNNA